MSRVAYPARRGMCFYWVPGTRYQVLDLVAVQIGSQHRSHPIYNRPSMTPARIAALLEPFLQHALSDTQLNQISTYIDLLLRWNARMNLTAIRDAGLRCPDDVSVMGFDDLDLAETTNPSLSSVSQSGYQLGTTAARILLERIQGDTGPSKHIVLETSLRVRDSIAAPPSIPKPERANGSDRNR